MKILYVSTISNTVNAFLVPHIKMIIEAGHQVDVAFNINSPVHEELIKLGCQIYEIDFDRSPFKNNYRKLVNKIKNIIMEKKYDLVHTHTPIASAIVRLASKDLPNVQVMYTAHGFHFFDGAPLKNWLVYYPIEKILSRYTDTIITINDEDYRRAQKFDAKNVEFVPGVGLDLEEVTYSPVRKKKILEELSIENKDIILLSVGELNNNKNHKIVLEAIAQLKNDSLKYYICGSGILKEKLIRYSTDLGIENQVYFLGRRNDIYEMLHISDVFIFPSYREGLSKALMEAMAMEKPIIASDIRGNRDLVDKNKGGWLFNPKDLNQLTYYINKLIENPDDQIKFGKYNKKKITSYSMEVVLKKMKAIYRTATL